MSTDGICHTLPMAKHDLEHYASANTESVTNDLPKASRSQTILKFRPPKEAWITGSATIPSLQTNLINMSLLF